MLAVGCVCVVPSGLDELDRVYASSTSARDLAYCFDFVFHADPLPTSS